MAKKKTLAIPAVETKILTIRGRQVIVDSDLAELYEVETRRLNEQVRRNEDRFPEDFAFRLTAEEFADLISHNATSSSSHGGRRKPPYVFTEHGALMAANVLRSPRAAEMSVFIVRAFVKMRQQMALTQDLAKRLAEIEKKLVVHDTALVQLFEQIRPLLLPPEDPPRRKIGFHAKEKPATYRAKRAKKRTTSKK